MTVSPRDAHVLARLMAGQSLNGEVNGVSDRYRPIARRLNRTPVEQRSGILTESLPDLDDGDDLVKAVAAADPDGPEPGSDEWPEPLVLNPIPAEPFPLKVLPNVLVRLTQQAAQAIGCPEDFIALPALVVAAAAIGRTASLMIKPGYFEQCVLYGVPIGMPSDGKSPAIKAATDPLERIARQLAVQHQKALKAHREAMSQPTDKKAPKTFSVEEPIPPRIYVNDATMEVLPLILADNPRGLAMILDELAGLATGLNQYKSGGKGNDRQTILKLWTQHSLTKDRVNTHRKAVCVPHPFLCIIGGLVPDMLGELTDAKGRNDGFLDRWLVSFPERLPKRPWSKKGVPQETADAWYELVNRLWSRSMINDPVKGLVPHVFRMTSEAEKVWEELINAHRAEQNAEDFNPSLLGPWGKLEQYAGRFALELTLLHQAAEPAEGVPGWPDTFKNEVDRKYVEDAWTLVPYFKNHFQRALAVMEGGRADKSGDDVKGVLDWIRRHGKLSFSERDLTQNFRKLRGEDLAGTLKWLVDHECIRRQPEQGRPDGKPGRTPTPVYNVNPGLHPAHAKGGL